MTKKPKTRNNVNLEYLVPIKVVFEGMVTVEAMTKMEARETVEQNFWATIGQTGDNQNVNIKDIQVDVHSSEIQYKRVTRK